MKKSRKIPKTSPTLQLSQKEKQIIEQYGITGEVEIEKLIDFLQTVSQEYNEFYEKIEKYMKLMQLSENKNDVLKSILDELWKFFIKLDELKTIAWCYALEFTSTKAEANKGYNEIKKQIRDIKKRRLVWKKKDEELNSELEVLESEFSLINLENGTEKYFQARLQKLQEDLQTIEQTRTTSIILTTSEKNKIENQIEAIKGRILATIMAYSETQPINPIIHLKFEGKEISIDCRSQNLPKILGLVKDKTDESDHIIGKVATEALEQEYIYHIFEGLRDLRIIDTKSQEERTAIYDEFVAKQVEFEKHNNKALILLKKYYHIGSIKDDLDLTWLHQEREFSFSQNPVAKMTDNSEESYDLDGYEKLSSYEQDMFELKEKIGDEYFSLVFPFLENLRITDFKLLKIYANSLRMNGNKKKNANNPKLVGNFSKIRKNLNGVRSQMEVVKEHILTAIRLKYHIEYAKKQTPIAREELDEQIRKLENEEKAFKKKSEIYEKALQAFNKFTKLLGIERKEKVEKVLPRISAEDFFTNELQNLQKKVEGILQILNSNRKISPSKYKELKNQILNYKIQFLVAVMAYSETIPSNQIVWCQIGEKRVSLHYLLEELPTLLGLVERININDKNNYPPQTYDIILSENEEEVYAIRKDVRKVLEKQYESYIPDKLMNIQLLRAPNLTDLGFDSLTEFLEEYGGYKDCKNKIDILLKKYCNIGIVEDEVDPLMGLEMVKNANPDVLTEMNDISLMSMFSEVLQEIQQADELLER